MPETYVRIQLPDGREETIYSPSSIIRTYFHPATELELAHFESLFVQALDHASRRVEETYGFACSSAMAEKKRISQVVSECRGATEQIVKILTVNS